MPEDETAADRYPRIRKKAKPPPFGLRGSAGRRNGRRSGSVFLPEDDAAADRCPRIPLEDETDAVRSPRIYRKTRRPPIGLRGSAGRRNGHRSVSADLQELEEVADRSSSILPNTKRWPSGDSVMAMNHKRPPFVLWAGHYVPIRQPFAVQAIARRRNGRRLLFGQISGAGTATVRCSGRSRHTKRPPFVLWAGHRVPKRQPFAVQASRPLQG